MGRGRQKAKHTKVARELKYFSPSTDLTALEKEIGHPTDEDSQYIDKWADLYGTEEDDEEDDLESSSSNKNSAEEKDDSPAK
jgi:hypothetical protein